MPPNTAISLESKSDLHPFSSKLKLLIQLLRDGHFHSGTSLGQALGISRAAIWKLMQQLKLYDIPFKAVPKKGYALLAPIEFLRQDSIQVHLDPDILQIIQRWIIVDTLPSTAQYLMENFSHFIAPTICLSEHQSRGHGRRGNPWISPYGYNIYLSISWYIDADVQDFSGLHIALGLAIRHAIQMLIPDLPLTLKWPNDLLVQEKKLGGILIETRSISNDACYIVASCGINTFLTPSMQNQIPNPSTDLDTFSKKHPIGRNALAGSLINAILHTLKDWPGKLNPQLLDEWVHYDSFYGQTISITRENKKFLAVHQGIDANGRLLIQKQNGLIEAISSAEFFIQKNRYKD